MKTIKVVAAVIQTPFKIRQKYMQQLEDMENLRGNGNFQEEK